MAKQQAGKKSYPSDARNVGFRIKPELADKMVACGFLDEEFTRSELSNAVSNLLEKHFESVTPLQPADTPTIRELDKKIEELKQLVLGKQLPRTA